MEDDLDYELRWKRSTSTARTRGVTPGRDYRAGSAFPEDRGESRGRSLFRDFQQRGSSSDRDYYRGSSVYTSRNVRASSVLPGSLRHYDDLAEADEALSSGYGYVYNNAGLHQAKRALSEARDLLRESSMSREMRSSSVYDSVSKSKTSSSRLEDIRELSSDVLREIQARKGTLGTYKITVTPTADSWSRVPRRLWSSSTTAALLEAYSPRNFPDFIFGRYTAGQKLGAPLSATQFHYDRPVLDGRTDEIPLGTSSSKKYSSYENSSYDYDLIDSSSSRAASRARSRSKSRFDRAGSSYYGQLENGAEYDYSGSNAAAAGRRLASRAPSYYGREGSSEKFESAMDNLASKRYKYNYDIDPVPEAKIVKCDPTSKYYHYFIPRHFEGTPMVGGYLVPHGRSYGWKY